MVFQLSRSSPTHDEQLQEQIDFFFYFILEIAKHSTSAMLLDFVFLEVVLLEPEIMSVT